MASFALMALFVLNAGFFQGPGRAPTRIKGS